MARGADAVRRNRTNRLTLLAIVCNLAIILACGLIQRTSGTVFVTDPTVASVADLPSLEVDSGFFEIIRKEPNRVIVDWHNTHIEVADVFRVPRRGGASVQLVGRVNDGFEYPVVLDTGYADQILVTDSIVRQSKLPIHPLEDFCRGMAGICAIDRLQIGRLTLVHPLAVYIAAAHAGLCKQRLAVRLGPGHGTLLEDRYRPGLQGEAALGARRQQGTRGAAFFSGLSSSFALF